MSMLVFLVLLWCGAAQAQTKSAQGRPRTSSVRVENLRGIWWSTDPEPSAAFVFSDTTISYPDMFVTFRYRLSADTLLVERDDGVALSIVIRSTKDTLILKTWDMLNVYTRLEPR